MKDAWWCGLCFMQEMSSHFDDPSVRFIRNRAIWMDSDWFQYGSTKSDNRSECQSNQSSELSSQQPIRSVLIKLGEGAGGSLCASLTGSACQCPKWIFCGTSAVPGLEVNSYMKSAQRKHTKWVLLYLLYCFNQSCMSGLMWNWYYSILCKPDSSVK